MLHGLGHPSPASKGTKVTFGLFKRPPPPCTPVLLPFPCARPSDVPPKGAPASVTVLCPLAQNASEENESPPNAGGPCCCCCCCCCSCCSVPDSQLLPALSSTPSPPSDTVEACVLEPLLVGAAAGGRPVPASPVKAPACSKVWLLPG
eukprot:1159240-Pelagomonas_calceolata.AAC.1